MYTFWVDFHLQERVCMQRSAIVFLFTEYLVNTKRIRIIRVIRIRIHKFRKTNIHIIRIRIRIHSLELVIFSPCWSTVTSDSSEIRFLKIPNACQHSIRIRIHFLFEIKFVFDSYSPSKKNECRPLKGSAVSIFLLVNY